MLKQFSTATKHFNLNINIHLLKIESKYFGFEYETLTTDFAFKGRQYIFGNVMNSIKMLTTLNRNIFTIL